MKITPEVVAALSADSLKSIVRGALAETDGWVRLGGFVQSWEKDGVRIDGAWNLPPYESDLNLLHALENKILSERMELTDDWVANLAIECGEWVLRMYHAGAYRRAIALLRTISLYDGPSPTYDD